MKQLIALSFFILMFTSSSYSETLQDCLIIAQKHSPVLQQSKLQLEKIYKQKNISSSPLFPQISSSASVREQQQERVSVQARQLIFDGFKTFNKFQQAKFNAQAYQQEFNKVSANLRYSVTTAYLDILFNQEKQRINASIKDTRLTTFKLIELRHKSGQEHKGALLIARANLNNAAFEEEKSRQDQSIAVKKLETILGYSLNSTVSSLSSLKPLKKLPKISNFVSIAKKTPSVVQASYYIEASKANLKSSKQNNAPKLYANIDYTHTPELVSNPDDTSYSASLSLPLLDGGSNRSQIKIAKKDLLISTLSYEDIVNKKAVSIEEKLLLANQAIDRVSLAKQNLDASKVRFDIASAQYSSGLIGFNNWLIIENELISTQRRILETQLQAYQAIARFWLELGKGLQDDIKTL